MPSLKAPRDAAPARKTRSRTPKVEVASAAPLPSASKPALANAARVAEIFRRFEAAEPAPQGELEHVDPYTLLVAVVLSAQTTDAGVNKATRQLFANAGTPAKMIALGEERIREQIKSIGLFRTKAKNVIALSRALISDHGGEVPRVRAALESLPGVGRKTANVVLNTAFGEPTIAVDTHVLRVSNRIALAIGGTPGEVEAGLETCIPDQYKRHAHHWLILHGRYVCIARRPACGRCLINDQCAWPEKTTPSDA